MRKQRASAWLGASLRGASSPAVLSNPKLRLAHPTERFAFAPLYEMRARASLSDPHLT